MSTRYNGNQANVSDQTIKLISAATNATPIVVTTTTSHGFGDKDDVVITGVGGNTATNGGWVITWLSPTTFSLNGSVGSGAYTAGGSVLDQSLLPPETHPADGDLESAASVNNALQNHADKLQFLGRRGPRRVWTFSTASATMLVPPGVNVVKVVGIGGGGGGGGGAGSTLANVGCGGAGGGGARKVVALLSVVPGETLTVVRGAGGAGGPAGAVSTDAASGGQPGGNGTVTGSLSGLLATFRGAGGGTGARVFGAGSTYSYGGQPCSSNPGVGSQWIANTSTIQPPVSAPGAGGSQYNNGVIGELYSVGGSTAANVGGLGGNTGGAQNTSCGGGASEWPGGIGGAGIVGGLVAGVVGTAGVYGSGGAGGGGAGNNIGAATFAGGAGGAGGDGICHMEYYGQQAIIA